MYLVTCDNVIIYDLRVDNRVILSPTLDLEVGKNGSFSFTIPPQNIGYDLIKEKKSIIQVFQLDNNIDNNIVQIELFRGSISSVKKDFWKRKLVDCEGELSFFCDSIVRPYSYQGDVKGLFQRYVNEHNSKVSSEKRFRVRNCNVIDSNDYITRANINYPTTRSEMEEKLIGILEGHFETGENEQGRFIDYLSSYDRIASQNIEFGVNLLDLSEIVKTDDVATRIIALGAKNEDTGERLTIASVNNGLDYVEESSAVALFGVIEKTVEFDDVTDVNNLLRKAKQELEKVINKSISIELSAADMHNLNKKIQSFRIGDNVRVISKPHGLDRYFLLSKLHLSLDSPSSCSMTLGSVFKSLTQKQIESERRFNSNVQNIIGTTNSIKTNMINIQKTAEDAKTLADNNKVQIDNFIVEVPQTYVSNTDFNDYKVEVNQKIGSVYRICGSVAGFGVLKELQSCSIGDVYNCLDTGANYVFTDFGWDKLSETIDLSKYLTIADAEDKFVKVAVLSDYALKSDLKGYLTSADAESIFAKIADLEEYLKNVDAENLYTKITDFEDLVKRIEDLENINKENRGAE